MPHPPPCRVGDKKHESDATCQAKAIVRKEGEEQRAGKGRGLKEAGAVRRRERQGEWQREGKRKGRQRKGRGSGDGRGRKKTLHPVTIVTREKNDSDEGR